MQQAPIRLVGLSRAFRTIWSPLSQLTPARLPMPSACGHCHAMPVQWLPQPLRNITIDTHATKQDASDTSGVPWPRARAAESPSPCTAAVPSPNSQPDAETAINCMQLFRSEREWPVRTVTGSITITNYVNHNTST